MACAEAGKHSGGTPASRQLPGHDDAGGCATPVLPCHEPQSHLLACLVPAPERLFFPISLSDVYMPDTGSWPLTAPWQCCIAASTDHTDGKTFILPDFPGAPGQLRNRQHGPAGLAKLSFWLASGCTIEHGLAADGHACSEFYSLGAGRPRLCIHISESDLRSSCCKRADQP